MEIPKTSTGGGKVVRETPLARGAETVTPNKSDKTVGSPKGVAVPDFTRSNPKL